MATPKKAMLATSIGAATAATLAAGATRSC